MEMIELCDDPYERKLYHMFQSCDTEHCGSLDEAALRRLCSLLELRDKGALLIEDLVADGSLSRRVSFVRFKGALLQFLGTELDTEQNNDKYYNHGKTTAAAADERRHSGCATLTDNETELKSFLYKMGTRLFYNQSNGYSTVIVDMLARKLERVLVISDKNVTTTYAESPPELSDREIAPKLVVGTKKYGRRSRPQQDQFNDGLSLSDSEHNDDDELRETDNKNFTGTLVQRSSSQTDIIAANRNRRSVALNGSKLKRCSSLPAQRNLKAHLAAKKYDKLQQSEGIKKNQNNSSVESLDAPATVEVLPKHVIMDILERANIANGRKVLLALGFDDDEINLAQLNKVLEEEVRNSLEEDTTTHAIFLRALFALQTTELANLRVSCRHLQEENLKLRADSKEANKRVALMAVEIDERHAILEDTSKKELHALEQRHASVLRELSTRMANDREHWTQLTTKLEKRVKSFEEDELKLRTELDLLRVENQDMETEQQKLQRQLTEFLEQNVQLNRKLSGLDDDADERRLGKSLVTGQKTLKEHDEEEEQMLHLLKKVANLQLENTQLRDKNDELLVELENLNVELLRYRTKEKKSSTVTVIDYESSEDIDNGAVSGAVKRRGDSPSKTRLPEESPRLGKLRKCEEEDVDEDDGEALNTELQISDKAKPEIASLTILQQRILELEECLRSKEEKQMQQEEQSDVASNKSTDERCKELEASLEQMARAYEDCEDYWQMKLSEERQSFEKERQLYEEEQQENDKKFTELMEKVREYEEQFSKESRLSPIEEKDVLEQQYADLEAEAEQLREQARRMWEEKAQEIEKLQQEVSDLKLRLGESVEILTGATELHTEAQAAAALQGDSPASSPISYLWQQSTIQQPAKHIEELVNFEYNDNKAIQRNKLTTTETTVFSTTASEQFTTVAPIQKPSASASVDGDGAESDKSSIASAKSFDTHSVASTHSIHNTIPLQTKRQSQTTLSHETSRDSHSPSPSGIKEELKRLKFFELSLKERVKDLTLQRDGLVMELQQLQEARPVLEKAYARTAHPTLIQRVNQLELRNRHLQNVIKQHQQYTESLMQQSWRQHQMELNDLHTRIEAQNALMTEQVHRLQNADVLVKDLYVENSHLTATVQRLEQQHVRTQMLHNMQQQSNGQQNGAPLPLVHHQRAGLQGLSGLPGMP